MAGSFNPGQNFTDLLSHITFSNFQEKQFFHAAFYYNFLVRWNWTNLSDWDIWQKNKDHFRWAFFIYTALSYYTKTVDLIKNISLTAHLKIYICTWVLNWVLERHIKSNKDWQLAVSILPVKHCLPSASTWNVEDCHGLCTSPKYTYLHIDTFVARPSFYSLLIQHLAQWWL